MRLPTEAETLQASAIIVAAPRYCGAFASAIGIDILSYWPGFAHIEIGSGAAMAILEGWAIAFMFRKWGAMDNQSIRWKVLLTLQLVLMITLPMVATPYLISSQFGEPVKQIMGLQLIWAWSFIVAAVAPLILAAVGYADVQESSELVFTPDNFALDNRQQQIVKLLADGKAVKDISNELNVSRPTIYKDLEKLELIGVTHKNGNGWELVR